MTTQGWILLAILAAAIVGFASNWFRVDGVAMFVLPRGCSPQ